MKPSNGGKKRALIYTRVSTDEQAEKGYSLRHQEQRLRQYCRLQGIEVVRHYQDDASAKTFERPGFQEMLDYLKRHPREIDAVFFVKWDRFSRNTHAAYAMIDRLQNLGVEVQAVEQPIDMSVPEQRLLLAFYLAAPEVENRRRSLNTKMGMRQAMREGRWVSKPPKGYERARDESDNSIIVPDEDAPFVREAFEEIAKGVYTAREVLRKLRKKGFKCSKSHFIPMLRNPIYMGKIHISAWRDEEEELVEGVHEPLVSESLFKKVQAVLDAGAHDGGLKKKRREEFPLRGYLKCRRCGGNLTGSSSRGNGGTYHYYHCQYDCKESFRADEANEAFVDYLDSIAVAPEVAELYLAVMKDIFKEKEGDREQQIEKVERKIRELKKKLLKVDERYLEDDLARDSYLRLKDSYQDKLEKQQQRKAELERRDTNFMRYARYGLSLVADLPKSYQRAPVEIKQKLVGLIFPGKVVYDEGDYRTNTVNEVIALLGGKKADFDTKKDGLTAAFGNQSGKAALPGFEPGTP